MPSTFSPDLALELMATGEDSGVWGNKTNNNLSPLIEEAIVGSATITFVDADQTINMLNGVDCPARNLVLDLAGTNTAQRTLTVPTIKKTYVVYNGVSGGFGIQVKTAAGTGIIVPSGGKMYLYVDGTNVTNLFDTLPDVNVLGSTSGLTSLQATAVASGVLTLPAATDTIVARATTDTLTNKTLTDCVANTQTAGNNSTKLATTAYVDAAISLVLPPGMMMPYALTSAPTGWLLSNGQAVSRTTYAALFAMIGTSFGSGDGSTTFNLPDMRGRVAAGLDDMGASAAGRLTSATMTPNGTTLGAVGGQETTNYTTSGSIASGGAYIPNLSVSVFGSGTTNDSNNGGSGAPSGTGNQQPQNHGHNFSVSSSGTAFGNFNTSIFGTTTGTTNTVTNVQPALLLSWIIKT